MSFKTRFATLDEAYNDSYYNNDNRSMLEKIQDGELSNRDFKELKKERDVLENKMILNSLPLFKEPIPEKKIEQTTEDWSEPTEDWSEPVKWDK